MNWPWRKTKPAPPPPESLDVRHSYVNRTPGSNTFITQYPSAQPAGKPTYATPINVGPGALPDIGTQDASLNHYDRVPDGGVPGAYWSRRNMDKDKRNSQERRFTLPGYENPFSNGRGPDPKWIPPAVSRPTIRQIPVNGHGTQVSAFGHHSAYELTGVHSSLALVRRNYPIGGLRPQERARNTMRVIPPSFDATAGDLEASTNFTSQAGIYVSPSASVPGIGYGLRGGF